MKSYHHRRSSPDTSKRSGGGLEALIGAAQLFRGFGGTVALVAGMLLLNFGVISYHGDPRELFGLVGGERAEAAEQPKTEPKPAVETKTELSPVVEAEPAQEKPPMVESPAKVTKLSEETMQPEMQVKVRGDKKSLSAALASLSETYSFEATLPQHEKGRVVSSFQLKRNEMPSDALLERGFSREEIARAFSAISEHVDFRRISPRCKFATAKESGRLVELEIACSRVERSRALLGQDGQWTGVKEEVPIVTTEALVSGTIESSLWGALTAQGESVALVTQLVDIFSWDIDFYSEIHKGDHFKVLVEKQFAGDDFVGYGDVLGAEFAAAGETYRAFYHDAEERAGYFDESGSSMEKMLLKSPLKYAANITSRFGRRRHPVLGYTRMHKGVDYGVPTGTPIWSVGEGRILRAGLNGGYGKFVEIKHANGWVSRYAHLSRIDVRRGQKVKQKDIIGAVGSTGMSTGPHLHYELLREGRHVNPQSQKFKRGKPLSGNALERYLEAVNRVSDRLDSLGVATSSADVSEKG